MIRFRMRPRIATARLRLAGFLQGEALQRCTLLVLQGFALQTLFFTLCGCTDKSYHRETRLMMGTIVEVICQDKFAINAAFDEIKKIETIANNFNPDSELSRLNRLGEISASPELFDLIKQSVKYYNLSGGVFDVTVRPVVAIWKDKIYEVSVKGKNVSLPEKSIISNALSLVGSNNISIDENNRVIKFLKPGMSIDLGGIAKGYAVDCALARLKALGVKSALVNAGGNMYCLGLKGSHPWRVGVRDPRDAKRYILKLELENKAIATSGDYEQYFILNGVRYSHIIDPKTGYPAQSGVMSATIISNSAAMSDALSTAVFVIGKERGLALLRKIGGVKAEIFERQDAK